MMCYSTDPRDRIYAVMGMLNDVDDPMPDPDYGASTSDIIISWGNSTLINWLTKENTRLQICCLVVPRTDIMPYLNYFGDHIFS